MQADDDDAAYVQDMTSAAELVIRYVAGKSLQDFAADRMLKDAVERRIEIFGEAARNISNAPKLAHSEIPWHKITAIRHILAHDYDVVDEEIVWRVATEHLPATLPLLKALLPPPPADTGA